MGAKAHPAFRSASADHSAPALWSGDDSSLTTTQQGRRLVGAPQGFLSPFQKLAPFRPPISVKNSRRDDN